MRLPFIHLNLRQNPFGELTEDDRTALAVVDPSALVRWSERLTQERFALQFLGDAGHGKSTHLSALRAGFLGAPFTYVPEEGRPKLPEVDSRSPYFIDEVQRLRPRPRRRIFARAPALVLGSHEDLAHELARAGFVVETITLTGPTLDSLRQILCARIEWARRSPGSVPTIPDHTVEALLHRFGGDVRAMEALLYERLQAMKEIGDVEV